MDKFELIKRGTQEIVDESEVKKLLKSKKTPVVYVGYAPTGLLHVGHFIPMVKLIDFLKDTGVAPVYTEEVTKTSVGIRDSTESQEEKDELFKEAVEVVCRYKRASSSLLQRSLKVGYARAARILDQLERAGIVGPHEGSKPRELLIKKPEDFFKNS